VQRMEAPQSRPGQAYADRWDWTVFMRFRGERRMDPEAGDKLYCNLRVAASSANLISAAAKASHPAGSTVA
jgi:hypothetical protein